ncbi:hypothetical protein D3C76_1462760 [compost metagenome]
MLDRFGAGFHAGIKDKISRLLGQRINRRGYFIARIHFIIEPLALAGYEDRSFAAHGFADQVRFLLLHGRVNLDLIHIDRNAA